MLKRSLVSAFISLAIVCLLLQLVAAEDVTTAAAATDSGLKVEHHGAEVIDTELNWLSLNQPVREMLDFKFEDICLRPRN
jgi:hypothetical protein